MTPRKRGELQVDQILPFVSDIGFPIIVTLYLLHRIETKLDTLNETLVELPDRLREGIPKSG
ncbi:YvrJ family protein [Peribacillus simplex]|uniref:YvrJ family protein n=1 Tax=Peribacillus simplex TaxID=1478 RepID=A0AAW7IDU0_9BACI|nr:YvrJ family protein [Peribacillus simplex]MDM5452182.1 YvrJ family protein [Peribacillus simplex]